MEVEEITEDQFRRYEEIRQYGKWNMLEPNAQRATGLDKDTYMAVLQHYTELNDKYPHVRVECRELPL